MSHLTQMLGVSNFEFYALVILAVVAIWAIIIAPRRSWRMFLIYGSDGRTRSEGWAFAEDVDTAMNRIHLHKTGPDTAVDEAGNEFRFEPVPEIKCYNDLPHPVRAESPWLTNVPPRETTKPPTKNSLTREELDRHLPREIPEAQAQSEPSATPKGVWASRFLAIDEALANDEPPAERPSFGWSECHCPCHGPNGETAADHCIPCCSPCSHCGLNIAGDFKAHMRGHFNKDIQSDVDARIAQNKGNPQP